jgi:hypothetical protein
LTITLRHYKSSFRPMVMFDLLTEPRTDSDQMYSTSFGLFGSKLHFLGMHESSAPILPRYANFLRRSADPSLCDGVHRSCWNKSDDASEQVSRGFNKPIMERPPLQRPRKQLDGNLVCLTAMRLCSPEGDLLSLLSTERKLCQDLHG